MLHQAKTSHKDGLVRKVLQVWEMLSDEVLLTIRNKYEHYPDTDKLNPNTAVLHIRLLLEEIDRLKELEWELKMLNK